jgi:Arc/MetJ-type ribon-helix-helix transcriptional regulator
MSRLRTMTVKLPPSLSAKIARLAKKIGASQSEVVREALQAYSGEEQPSFADVAADYCGAAKGPGDLASNRRHLEDFGK